MKKIYRTPNTKVVKANIQAVMLGGSVTDEISNKPDYAKGFYPDFEEEEEMDGMGW